MPGARPRGTAERTPQERFRGDAEARERAAWDGSMRCVFNGGDTCWPYQIKPNRLTGGAAARVRESQPKGGVQRPEMGGKGNRGIDMEREQL